MSDLGIRILRILHGKSCGEHIYLKGREELSDFDKDEIHAEAERMTQAGLLVTVRTDQFIEIEHNLVNYFYEITDTGKHFLLQKTGT